MGAGFHYAEAVAKILETEARQEAEQKFWDEQFHAGCAKWSKRTARRVASAKLKARDYFARVREMARKGEIE